MGNDNFGFENVQVFVDGIELNDILKIEFPKEQEYDKKLLIQAYYKNVNRNDNPDEEKLYQYIKGIMNDKRITGIHITLQSVIRKNYFESLNVKCNWKNIKKYLGLDREFILKNNKLVLQNKKDLFMIKFTY